ncbi:MULTISPECIES: hypothetical protein [unclassified Nitratiruptor]|uniref:hypothetical protein n=1 Tax=unclassified Nitratiruptor TaxID=2624044 RepID=UPI00191613E5|nr:MULTISPECIES: hypothetical protein [unclassified Nitratiruptor]BCD60982.1 hypothetical protein NitYY0810_C1763 [Nitratiruptor sp. YY08-10]BCD64914.1 hypothetical protein NitYY0814_C1771 [Nitratiruptor sp. YY08-14]
MKKLLLILPLLLFGADKPCTKCNLNKSQMKCEYYLIQKGDTSKAKECVFYADYLDQTKVYGKASWYYLLALKPKKAIEAAKKAIQMGENFAYEYLGDAYLILGDEEAAKKSYQLFKQKVGNTHFFVMHNFKILRRIYNNFDAKKAEKMLQ